MDDCWADGVTAQITNLVLQRAVCEEAQALSRWSGCCSAAALPHFTGWVNRSHHQWSAGRNVVVFQSCTVYLKSGSKHLSKDFFLVSLWKKAQLNIRK